jgi:hypothetical protein
VPVLSTETAIVRPADIEEKVSDPVEAFTRTPEGSPVAAAARSSFTVLGSILLFIGWLAEKFNGAIEIAIEAVAELTRLDAIKTLASGTKIAIGAATLSLVAIFLVVGRRLYAAKVGKVG